jgi:hypothetical protein
MIKRIGQDVYDLAKRHWVAVLLIILLLLVLPTFLYVLWLAFRQAVAVVGKFFGVEAGQWLAEKLTAVYNSIQAAPWWLFASIVLVNPFAGWLLWLWWLLDKLVKPDPDQVKSTAGSSNTSAADAATAPTTDANIFDGATNFNLSGTA